MYKTIDPITLTSWLPYALILTVGGDSHVLCRVALHCILPLYQFQCLPGASKSSETVQSMLVGYVHSVHWYPVWRLVQS